MPRKSWWARLPFGVRMTVGTSALLLAIAGVLSGFAALTKDGPDAPRIVTAVGDSSPTAENPAADSVTTTDGLTDMLEFPPSYAPVAPGSVTRTPDQAGRTDAREPRPPAPTPSPTTPPATTKAARATAAKAAAAAAARAGAGAGAGAVVGPARAAAPRPAPAQPRTRHKPPVVAHAKPAKPAKPAAQTRPDAPVKAPPRRSTVTTRIDYEKRDVAFPTRYVRDPMLPQGFRRVQSAGAPGQETLRYRVTLTNGRETRRKLVATTVTREPRSRVVLVGSRRDFDPFDDDGGRGDCDLDFDLCGPFGRQAIGYCPDRAAKPAIPVLDTDVRDEVSESDCDTREELPTLRQ